MEGGGGLGGRVQRALALSASKSALRSLDNFTIRRPRLRLGFYYHQQSSLFCHLHNRWSFDPGLCLHPHSIFVALITSSNARVGRRKVEKTEKNLHNSVGSLLLLQFDGEFLQNVFTSEGVLDVQNIGLLVPPHNFTLGTARIPIDQQLTDMSILFSFFLFLFSLP